MKDKIQTLLSKFSAVEEKLGDPNLYSDKKKFLELTQEHAYLSEIKTLWDEIQLLKKQQTENDDLYSQENDPEFCSMLKEEQEKIKDRLETAEKKLESLLIPPDPTDHYNAIVEIRAGTGGEEAALFVADCARMYKLFADRQGWQYELLSCAPSEMGGFKEYVMVLSGKNVYRYMKFEGGTHRVQRVPETEAQGRVHTSAITVAVLLEPEEKEDIELDEKDLRIDTYRSSGAGGQHVNTTDSAVRITYIPTGDVAYCQEERSQHKNKEKALRLLKAKIREIREKEKEKERSTNRLLQVGSGDRSERIRTYNFPQNRVTDHRVNLTKYHLDRIMEGELEDFSLALVAANLQEKKDL